MRANTEEGGPFFVFERMSAIEAYRSGRFGVYNGGILMWQLPPDRILIGHIGALGRVCGEFCTRREALAYLEELVMASEVIDS